MRVQAILLSSENKKRLMEIPDELEEAIREGNKNRAFALVQELKRMTRFTCGKNA